MTVRQKQHGDSHQDVQALWDATAPQITWDTPGGGLRWGDYDVLVSEDAQGPRLALAVRPEPLCIVAPGGQAADVTHRIVTYVGPRDDVRTLRGAANFLLALREILRAWLPTLPPDAIVYGTPLAVWPHRTYFLAGGTPRANVLPLDNGRLLIWQRADTLLARA